METISKDVERDFILNAQQAKDYGLVDEIIFKKEPAKLTEPRPSGRG